MNPTDMLERLVANAMDFLSRSMDEFDEQPKFSVIHFFTAVELLLKARLLAEHWSLVVSKCQIPDLKKFQAGDFSSVSLEEAAEKLEKVVASALSKEAIKTFKKLRDHRNKMVHFFHEAHSADKNRNLREEIAIEQLTAWYFLHRLLLSEWKSVFEPWRSEITQVDERSRGLRTYLQVLFDQSTAEIEKRKNSGSLFFECPSCGFKAYEHQRQVGEFYEPECLVCRFTEGSLISIECPDCGEPVFFADEGFGRCESCGRQLEPQDIAAAINDCADSCRSEKDAFLEGDANCSACSGYHTVIPYDGQYFCTSCFAMSDSLETCEFCGEPNNGDMSDSFLSGCGVCSGRLGWE